MDSFLDKSQLISLRENSRFHKAKKLFSCIGLKKKCLERLMLVDLTKKEDFNMTETDIREAK